MGTRHHSRTGSYGRKLQQYTRSAKPSTSMRSHNRGHSTATLSSMTSSRPVELEVIYTSEEYEDDNSMASFLQFCPTCEKQILTPSISVLYCSEACRRRDSKSSTQRLEYSPPLSPYTSALHDYPPATIVPRRSPTVLPPLTTTFSELSLYELNFTRSPKDDVDESTFGMPTQSVRPYINRNSSSDYSAQLPSLVHSPSSSYGTVASHFESSRPLPRKHSCPASKGIDLVTPTTVRQLPPSTTTTTTTSNVQEQRRISAPTRTTRRSPDSVSR